MKNQQAILILGMHRSGTSVLSRLCNISGAYLGESVIEPAADNPKGFWENKDIVLLHDELLEQLNRQWDTTMPLPDRWWDSPKIAATKQKLIDFLRDEFGDKPLWLVKDPRVCLLIPIWLDVLEELNVAPHFLIVNRSPEEIVESLQKRNDMHRDACHLLYLHHYLSAEYWSREFPRSVVNYHDILKDWQRVLIDASKAATIDWPIQAWDGVKGIADVVDSGLRHYEQEDFDRSDELSNLVGSVSDALLAMATGRQVEGSHIRTLDAVSEKLNLFERVLAPWQSQIELQVSALRESTNKLVIERERYQSVQKELRKVDSARIKFLKENKKLEAVRLKYQNEQVIERERYQSVEKELRKVDSARIKFLEENKKLEAVRLEYQAENTRLTEAHKRLQDDGKKLEGIRGLQQAEIITLKDGRDSLNEDVTRLEGINESQGITLEKLRSEQFENQQALEDAKGVLRDIRGENKILYQDIALLSAEQNRIRYSLDEILISTSWKLSAPIRMVGGGVKTIRDLFFLIGRILGSASNARKLIYKGKTAISNHGLLAVLYRLPEYARYARRSMSARGPSKVSVPAQGQEQRFNPHPNQLAEIETIDTDVSIVIPTFNAGDEFYWLLRKLRQQEGFGDLQIIVVDSGSTDDTVELARDADCVVIEIPQKDFSHSYSRNLGAESAKGDYLLFIVQDAYPIGDRWLYGMLSYVRDHADDGVTAVSCAEFCRGDSDVMYDCNVDTHYRFLGCLEYDSIGEYRADDHMSLRSEGQLSDISCLIPRKVFEKYRYMGDYAEDLDLGIRLIRNNNKIAMLASVKTIHSHNRPSYYYLKRSFVDVIFLVRQFEDFEIPRNLTFDGLFDSIINIAGALSRFMGQFETDYCGQTLREVLEGARVDLHTRISERKQSGVLDLQDDRFTVHLEQYRTDYTQSDSELSEADETTARAIADAFLARLDHFVEFSGDIYREQDQVLRKEILQMFGKTFAATVGSYIGFLYLNRESLDPKHAREIEAVCLDLQAGI